MRADGAQQLQEYLKDGPFVYELVACMVHQGGAQGGHYYAYLKDTESNQWLNFNDTRVSPIDELDIVEMFGGPSPGAQRGRMSTASNANAYMLIYSLVKDEASKESGIGSQEEIPDEVRDDVFSAEEQEKV